MSDAPFNAVPDDVDESREIASLVDVEPEDFDFDAFVAGARGARRAVPICPRGDLYAAADEIIELSSRPGVTEAQAADGLERLDELKHAIRQATRLFVVEGRSQLRRIEAHRAAGKRPAPDASPERHIRYATEVKLLELADAIVTPSGVTMPALRALLEECPSEVDKLTTAFEMACRGQKSSMLDF